MTPRFQRVYVEITNICNLRCAFCAPPVRPAAAMEPDFFAAILEQVRGLTAEVCLHVLGEPLGHPRFSVFLELCAQAGVRVNLTTNATLLSRHREHILASPAIGQINFSLHSFFHGERLDLATLEDVLSFCATATEKRPALYVNLRLWNLASLSSPPEKTLNARILERVAERFGLGGIRAPQGRKSLLLRGRIYLHRDTLFSWPGQAAIPEREEGFCHALSTHFAILADGTVCPCCLDAGGRLALGNIRDINLEKILAGPRAVAMREGFGRGRLVEELCRSCAYCRRFKTGRRGSLEKTENISRSRGGCLP